MSHDISWPQVHCKSQLSKYAAAIIKCSFPFFFYLQYKLIEIQVSPTLKKNKTKQNSSFF